MQIGELWLQRDMTSSSIIIISPVEAGVMFQLAATTLLQPDGFRNTPGDGTLHISGTVSSPPHGTLANTAGYKAYCPSSHVEVLFRTYTDSHVNWW